MALKFRYECPMRRLGLFLFAFAAFVIAASGVPSTYAQSVNWGPSVTSLGFGGSSHLGGVPPSVTSLGFGRMGAQSRNGGPHFQGQNFHTPMFSQNRNIDVRHHHRGGFNPGWGGYYAYPIFDYGDDYYQDNPDAADDSTDQDEYMGGPTIFDRRGDGQYPPPGTNHYSEPAQGAADANSSPAPQPSAEVVAQPKTVLVFKDGHQVRVDNYAIVGSTLYDLSGGRRHKIALADLDLTATAQQNDDRGVDFELPARSASN